jgi:hypothetical protein
LIATADITAEATAGLNPANHADRMTAASDAVKGLAVAGDQLAVTQTAVAVNRRARPYRCAEETSRPFTATARVAELASS